MINRLFLGIMMVLTFPSLASAEAGSWRFSVGYAFLSHVEELKDAYKHQAGMADNGNDIYNASINLSVQPYYQFKTGWRAGAGFGPLILLLGDARHIQMPVNLTLGYSFFQGSDYSPYFRAGISHHLATGDFYANSTPGFYGGIGIQMLITRSLRLGFEAAWDAAEISLDRAPGGSTQEHIKTGEVTLFLYADF